MNFNMDVSFFKEHLEEKLNLKESTIFQYTQVLSRFLVTNPDIENIESYNNFIIKYAIKKRNWQYYTVLKTYIDWKISDSNLKHRLIEQLIVPPKTKNIIRERRYLTEEKILEVINYLDTKKHKVVALIQTFTGVRAGDILKLKKGGIIAEEYKNKNILRLNIIGKGDKRNIVPIYDKVLQGIILDYILNNNGANEYYFLNFGKFTNRPGGHTAYSLYRMNYIWYWEDLNRALQTAGVEKKDFATHDFRRCFARRAWEKLNDIEELRRILNHSSVDTTMRYLSQSGLSSMDLHYKLQSK